eukprot:14240033-Heterocapsa_arctica.AAC.1
MQHRTRMVDIMQGSRVLQVHGCQKGITEAWDPYRERGDRIISEQKTGNYDLGKQNFPGTNR